MRTPLLAGFLVVLSAGCLSNEITGLGGNGEDEEEEQGSGSGSGSGSGNTTTPRVTATVDKTTLATENGRTETVTVTLTSENGFAGDVAIVKGMVDGSNAPIAAVTLDGPASVTLTANGTATAMYTVAIPANATGTVLTGSLKLALTSSAGTSDVTSAVTINNSYTVIYPTGTGTTATAHPNAGMAISVKRGTVIKFPNNDTIDHIIHGGNGFAGDHEGQTVGVDGLPGRTYEIPTIGYAPGTTGTMGCHTHGAASYATITLQ